MTITVLTLQGRREAGLGESQLGKLGLGDVKVDHLLLNTPQVDTRNVLNDAQLLLDVLGVCLQFRVAETVVADDGELKAEHVAEIIGDSRSAGTGRQLGLHVANLAAQLVPHLRQSV